MPNQPHHHDVPGNFLLARIAEDEAVARAVREQVRRGYAEDAVGSAMTIYFDVDYLQGGVNASATRVLAECEAKRRIVELHEPADYGSDCFTCSDKGGVAVEPYPCPTLRALALPYADHPDYRQEWKP